MNAAVRSIAGRLILGSALLLPLFLGASGAYLARSHRAALEAAEAERLRLQALTLLAQADYQDGSISLPERLIEARYNEPNSGLYAEVSGAGGESLWLSPSAVSLPPEVTARPPPALAPGERRTTREDGLYTLAWQVVWATEGGQDVPLLFSVMESAAPLEAELAVYRRGLLLWLGGSALLLLACQGAILGWGLRPLHRLAAEVAAIEAGRAEGLAGDYPREVQPLTSNLNTLLEGERRRRERVRNTLADLAHSLKTPLAVLGSADAADSGYASLVREQTGRMQQIVQYQLQRAAGGDHALLRLVPVGPLLERLRASLHKVYADRSLSIEVAAGADCRFRGDERDFLEVAGNLLDNACKYAKHRVRVSAAGGAPGDLALAVEDDGPGIPARERERLLQRGARLDQLAPGHGLGLAVSADVLGSYGGRLEIGDSDLGGARVAARFPGERR